MGAGAGRSDVSSLYRNGLQAGLAYREQSDLETAGLSLAPSVNLHLGEYFWAVTPVDAEGNVGVRSSVRSFTWAWPKAPSNLAVRDLIGPDEVMDNAFGSPLIRPYFFRR